MLLALLITKKDTTLYVTIITSLEDVSNTKSDMNNSFLRELYLSNITDQNDFILGVILVLIQMN